MKNNFCTFIGRLTRDPEMKYTPSGMAILGFSLATSESVKNKQTQEWEEKTTFVNFKAFSKIAERLSGLQKGQMVMLESKYSNGSYEKDGAKVYTHDFIVNDLLSCSYVKKQDDGGTTNPNNYKQPAEKPSFASDQIPF